MGGIGKFPSLIENLSDEMNAKRLGADRFKLLCGDGADLPAAHIPTVLQAMREGKPYPVKAFLVFGNNTLTTYGNTSLVYESLMKLDFMVCADLFMTPTAELADIVLPAAAWPEINQIAGLPTVQPMLFWPIKNPFRSENANLMKRCLSNWHAGSTFQPALNRWRMFSINKLKPELV